MTLDVPVPDSPELAAIDPNEYEDADVAGDSEYKREEIEALLREGAWADAFEEWAATSDLDEAEWQIVRDLDLVSRFDFFWDSFADRVGYHAPGLPEDWRERDLHPDLDSWGTVSGINAGLTELGQIVCETLKAEYIDWEADYEAPDDLPDFDA
ncbi:MULTISPECIES: hypothetical protein [Halopenitus]|uniref:DUF7992 domain-containing protein n=1 Tax=Halopenitus malekzadehii TaxID=1267564 RepID=A0A1H6II17_9EURY|nr:MULTISPECIES: hypothetical protein [Halopenitus]SEH47546.1 hypothetical protein SAMN05192561_102294 [Halopenitus malekzadehii]